MSACTPPGLGARLVADALGVNEAAELLLRHAFASPHGRLAALIADAAGRSTTSTTRVFALEWR
ncbi:hypothetical protein ACFRCW_23920 [Streptomyces sp. NPDC056653]|uniref:hypothetical protein n=1 Tax=Streptomyces sp. NPDC056653 TaxID=3345894 RepID=UPI00369E16E4